MSALDHTADIHARLAAAEAALHAVGQRIDPAILHLDVAVLIPCFNEAAAIGDVVKGFRVALPNARIYVYDNNSHDNTSVIARDAGAIVRREPLQGKGFVVRRMFADIEADVYILVDGDNTYDPAAAPRLLSRLVETQADMVAGSRITKDKAAYRSGHRFGNWALTSLVAWIFGDRFTDMLTGYRAFSRRFVKSYPAMASGFETETDLTVHALELDMITTEIQTIYAARPVGSHSKLHTLRDGVRILMTIGRLVRDERPMFFFGALATTFLATAGVIGAPIVSEYLATGLVPRLPTAFLVGTFAVLGSFSLVSGVILETVSRGRREIKRLAYNQIESITAKLERMAETRFTLDSLRAQALAENPVAETPSHRRYRAN